MRRPREPALFKFSLQSSLYVQPAGARRRPRANKQTARYLPQVRPDVPLDVLNDVVVLATTWPHAAEYCSSLSLLSSMDCQMEIRLR